MKKDKKHCIICGEKHYWNLESFQSGMDWKRQIHAISCNDCAKKIETNQVPDSRIQDHIFEAVQILEGKS